MIITMILELTLPRAAGVSVAAYAESFQRRRASGRGFNDVGEEFSQGSAEGK